MVTNLVSCLQRSDFSYSMTESHWLLSV